MTEGTIPVPGSGEPLDTRLDTQTSGLEVHQEVVVVSGADADGVLQDVQVSSHEGRTSLYTVPGFSNTESVHMDVSTATSGSVAYMAIDLSDTTVWKHVNTDHIVIEYMLIMVSPTANFLGDVRLGYLKNVDATNGDFSDVFNVNMLRKSDLFVEVLDFGSRGLHCDDAHHFGPVVVDSALFQTDVNLGGPDNTAVLTYPSGDGDLVLLVSGNGNVVEVPPTIGYETVAVA